MNSKKVFKFLSITFLITWTSFLIRAILCNTNVITAYSIVGILLYGIAVLGPAISSYICLDNRSPKSFLRMLFKYKKGTIKYFLILLILYASTFYISTFKLTNSYPIYLAPVVFGVMLLFGGCNEEVGWYGVLYPELEKKYKAPLATLISLVIWFIWHMPMFITKGDLHQNMSLVSFFLFLLTLALLKTALIRRTECVFYCGGIHAMANTAEAIFAYEQNTVMVISTLILWVIALILWYYPKDNEDKNDTEEKEVIKDDEQVITPIVNPELAKAVELPQEKEIEELI